MTAVFYYKATRPDGTDHWTGTVHYEVGKRIRPQRATKAPEMCGPGLLHAADVPVETLTVRGAWPCRLFEVRGSPVAGFDREHPHKGGFKELVVVREIEAWRALGPQGREVAALIERVGALTSEERAELAVSANVDAYPAWAALRDAGWTRECAWYAAWEAVWRTAHGLLPRWTWPVARAAVALVVRDLISPAHFDAMYGPWASVIDQEATR